MSDIFKLPGSDLLNPNLGHPPSSRSDEIFGKKTTGGKPKSGGVAKRKPEPEPEEGIWNPDPIPAESEPEKSDTGNKVRLHTLEWSLSEGFFCKSITVSAQGEIPSDIGHITRVQFGLVALDPNGKPESIDKAEGHLKDGRVQAEFTLYYPRFKVDGEQPTKCDYRFTAKHKYSKEEESKPLPVIKIEGELPDYDPGNVDDGEWGCFTEEPARFGDENTFVV